MKKIKILFVIDGIEFGGGERVFSQVINGLSRDRFDIFLISSPNPVFYSSIKHDNIHIHSDDFSRKFNPFLLFRLAKLLKENKIDIIHGQGARAEFYARFAKKLFNDLKYISTIAMPVEGFDVGACKKAIYRFFDYVTEKYVDRFIVVSDALKKLLIETRKIDAIRVNRIYNGIELDHYLPELHNNDFREQLGLQTDTPLIGAIGRMVWQKGFDYLLMAIPEVIKVFPKAKFLLVGEGPLRSKLKNMADSMNLDEHLIFSGFQGDIKNILASIDIFVAPSIIEGFPMVILEAMSMMKPIIASDISGISEQIIDLESGLLIQPKNSQALAISIIQVIRDKKLRSSLGFNARRRIEREFSIDKIISETESLYISLQTRS